MYVFLHVGVSVSVCTFTVLQYFYLRALRLSDHHLSAVLHMTTRSLLLDFLNQQEQEKEPRNSQYQ